MFWTRADVICSTMSGEDILKLSCTVWWASEVNHKRPMINQVNSLMSTSGWHSDTTWEHQGCLTNSIWFSDSLSGWMQLQLPRSLGDKQSVTSFSYGLQRTRWKGTKNVTFECLRNSIDLIILHRKKVYLKVNLWPEWFNLLHQLLIIGREEKKEFFQMQIWVFF